MSDNYSIKLDEIDVMIITRDITRFLSLPENDIQTYFEFACENRILSTVELLLKIKNNLQINKAFAYYYYEYNEKMIGLLLNYMDENFVDKHKTTFVRELIYWGEKLMTSRMDLIKPAVIIKLFRKGISSIDELSCLAIKYNNKPLLNFIMFNSNDLYKINLLKSSYLDGNYFIFKTLYENYAENGIVINEKFGITPSGKILEFLKYEELYRFKDIMDYCIENKNCYLLEILLIKMPKNSTFKLSKLEQLLDFIPDSLLNFIRSKFMLYGFESVNYLSHERISGTDESWCIL